ncbi:hypothetical protein [Amycolatopsis tolypomycina]|uniref:hypothetical protein n=1 Tax=Amycolatopsis tolypomycina TaxID=208445 RepID=UPI0033BC0CF2
MCTTGLVAAATGRPAGCCAAEPRPACRRLLNSRLVRAGCDEDKADDGVWAVTCFVKRKGIRRQGAARPWRDFARAVEGQQITVAPGQQLAWPGELFAGTRGIFADAGFTEVSRPTVRRVVMRLTC